MDNDEYQLVERELEHGLVRIDNQQCSIQPLPASLDQCADLSHVQCGSQGGNGISAETMVPKASIKPVSSKSFFITVEILLSVL